MNNFNKFNLILVYLIPVCLIFFHSLADFIVVLVGINFLVLLFLKKINISFKIIFADKVIKAFFLFYIFLVISSIFSEFVFFSLKRSLPYVRFLIFIIAFKYWLFADKNNLKTLYKSIAICVLFVCIDVLFQFYNSEKIVNNFGVHIKVGTDLFGFSSSLDIERFQGPFKDEFIAGGYIMKLSPFLLLSILSIANLKNNLFFLFLVIFVVYSIYITGDRSPFFVIIIISLILSIFFNKKVVFVYLSLLIFVLYFAGKNTDKKQRYIYDSLEAIGIGKNELNLDTGYGHLFYSAIKITMEKPLLGAGTKNYRKICHRDAYNFKSKNNVQLCSTHPHNHVLELLSETGLVGLILFCYIFFSLFKDTEIIKKLIKINFLDLDLKFSILSLVLILWPIATTGSIMTNKNSIILWLVFGILYSLITPKYKQ